MLRRQWLIIPLVVGLLAAPVFVIAADETAPEATPSTSEAAEALFAAGQIAAARDAFEALSKADPENAELAARVAVLEQVLELQNLVANEEISPMWERAACVLHAYFHQRGVPEVALAQDRAAHAKADSATTACLVAESLLTLDRDTETVQFVEGLREAQRDDQVRTYWGIAKARLGDKEAVLEDMDLFGWPETEDPGVLYDVARLHAVLGRHEEALSTLTASFEKCPPRALEGLKALAAASSDFAPLRETEGYAKVMATTSKVKAGGCHGDCGSCAEKSDCGSAGSCGEKSDCASCPDKGDCASCPEKDDCCGSCDGAAAKADAAATGAAAKADTKRDCSSCPEKGHCHGSKSDDCCGECDGDCEDCPCKEQCHKQGAQKKGCCGSCK